jgi:selenocysteine lyase/cysteine desulfurase/rhodanese-related sulfurtransferase
MAGEEAREVSSWCVAADAADAADAIRQSRPYRRAAGEARKPPVTVCASVQESWLPQRGRFAVVRGMVPPRSYADLVAAARARCREVDPGELGELGESAHAAGRRLVVLDVRERSELAAGTLPGATLLPRGIVEKHVADLVPDRDAVVVTVCESGNRALLVADVLEGMGYASVLALRGGVAAWRASGRALSPTLASGGTGPDDLRRVDGGDTPSWAQIRRDFPIVGRLVPVMGEGERPLVYMDHAASTHSPRSVLDRYVAFMSSEYANIHRGAHLLSRMATRAFDECYGVVAEFIGGDLGPDCVTFVTNTTQAIDLAAHVMAPQPGATLVTELEHHSNDLPHRRHGPVLRVRVYDDGSLDLDELERALRRDRVKLVAVTGASNVTGWMPDVHAIARLAHAHGARILVDAAQLLAHRAIDVRASDDPAHLDFLAGAGHKSYAPYGAAFLYGPRDLMDAAPPWMPGGGTASAVTGTSVEFVGSPDRHQGGTPNIAGVIAFAEALRYLARVGMVRVREHELALLRRAWSRLSAMEGVILYGPPDPAARLGVIPFNVEGVSDMLTAAVLSEEHAIACRNGRFCAHPYMDRLLAGQGRGAREGEAPAGAVRASIGLFNDEADIDRLIEAVDAVRLRRWAGKYRVREDGVSAEFAGRCNDRWMEADAPSGDEAS